MQPFILIIFNFVFFFNFLSSLLCSINFIRYILIPFNLLRLNFFCLNVQIGYNFLNMVSRCLLSLFKLHSLDLFITLMISKNMRCCLMKLRIQIVFISFRVSILIKRINDCFHIIFSGLSSLVLVQAKLFILA